MSTRGPKWDEIKSRSEQMPGGIAVFCGDCGTFYDLVKLPCRKHATPDESKQIDKLMTETLGSFRMVKR